MGNRKRVRDRRRVPGQIDAESGVGPDTLGAVGAEATEIVRVVEEPQHGVPAATVGIGLVTSRPFGDSSRVMKYPCSPSELAQKCHTPLLVTLSDRNAA